MITKYSEFKKIFEAKFKAPAMKAAKINPPLLPEITDKELEKAFLNVFKQDKKYKFKIEWVSLHTFDIADVSKVRSFDMTIRLKSGRQTEDEELFSYDTLMDKNSAKMDKLFANGVTVNGATIYPSDFGPWGSDMYTYHTTIDNIGELPIIIE